ncbi:hypothetical protein [Spirosoma agri]|uniref:DUF4177 domain-containing protein n=1 Tax=Spirosoma agri TaxID=1987381 RepID=A0A6M0IJM3_9BACT|nr:hypothetical protein [Spirosoma agri]NEU67825.1 hypothetical protein [Spirosoma agri]
MVIVDFEGFTSSGEYRQQSYGDLDIESCCEILSQLVKRGWRLTAVNCFRTDGRKGTALPIEAFTGEPMRNSIRQLQREWESLIVAL